MRNIQVKINVRSSLKPKVADFVTIYLCFHPIIHSECLKIVSHQTYISYHQNKICLIILMHSIEVFANLLNKYSSMCLWSTHPILNVFIVRCITLVSIGLKYKPLFFPSSAFGCLFNQF